MPKITRIMSVAKYNSTPLNMFVCEEPTERPCTNCEKIYTPDKNDISTKRPSIYFKTCIKCRNYTLNKKNSYELRDKLKLLNITL